MLKGALRPHPFLQGIIEKAIMQLRAGGGYMTLHARIHTRSMSVLTYF